VTDRRRLGVEERKSIHDKELRVEVIWLYYDVPAAKHGG